jgi:ligand-binding sensor domain-containing protein
MTGVKSPGILLIFLFTILFIYYSAGQSYLLSLLPVEKELPSRQITSIFQDSKGFIWIGTEDGLNLYNANSVKIFKHDVKNQKLRLNNYIQNVCEDKTGNIRISTAMSIDCYSRLQIFFSILQKTLLLLQTDKSHNFPIFHMKYPVT